MWQKLWCITVGTVVVASMAAGCAGPQQSVPQSPPQAMETPPGAKVLFHTEAGTTLTPGTGNRASTASKPRRPSQVAQSRVEPAPASGRETQRAPGLWLGLSYWVEWVQPDGTPKRLEDPTRFVFQSRDRVRFHVTTNLGGYLYVVNVGSSGQPTLLFPHAGSVEQHAWIEAHKEALIPAQGWIRFDERPGEEGIQFILSSMPVTDILGLIQNPVPGPAASGRFLAALDQRGAKDLVVETDATEGQQATYLVTPMATSDPEGPVLIYRTRLLHQ